MGGRFSVRITRFDDRQAFRRVVGFLGRLYPERQIAEFETGLARTPCTLSHDAAEAAAETLRDALQRRGAHVLLIPTELMGAGAGKKVGKSTQELSPEIDLSFLDKSRSKKRERPLPPPSSARAGASTPGTPGPMEKGKAPWEQ